MNDLKKCAITQTNDNIKVLLSTTYYDGVPVDILKCQTTGLVYVNEEKRVNRSFKTNGKAITAEEWSKEFPDDLDVYADDAWGETYQNTKDVYTWQYENVAGYVGKENLDKPDFTIAELGSARGYLLQRLKDNHPTVKAIGVEPSPVMGDIARSNGLDMRTGIFEDIGFAPKSLDAVVGFGCFIQVRDPLATLKEFNRSLKKGGKVVLDSPNSNSLFRHILLFLNNNPGLGRIFGLEKFIEKSVQLAFYPGRFYFYNPKTYSLLLKEAGFEVTQIKKRQPRYITYGKHEHGMFKRIILKTVSFLERLTGQQAWVQVGAVKVEEV